MTTDIHALAGAYVLNAVTDTERTEFARHLSQCEACAVEARELGEIVARLADGAWSVPPPRLRARVLAEVRQTRQLPPRRSDRDVPRRWPRWGRRGAYALAAGVLAVAATYAVTARRSEPGDQAIEQAQVDGVRVQRVLSSADAVLRGSPVRGGGRMTIVLSLSQDAGVVVLHELAPLSGDRAYQLWLVDGARPVSAGVLTAGASGGTRLISGVADKDLLAVTVEPAEGSAEPTLPTLAGIPMN